MIYVSPGTLQSGNGSPVGVVVPSYKGALYIDLTTPATWQATGVLAANWVQTSFPIAPSLNGVLAAAVNVNATTNNVNIMDTAALAIGTWLVTFNVMIYQNAGATVLDFYIAQHTATATLVGPIAASGGGRSAGFTTLTTLTAIITVTVAGTIQLQANNPSATLQAVAAVSTVTALPVTGYTALKIA